MPHLSIETLARLVDESADSHESAHLELCDLCRNELEGMKADAATLADLPEVDPPESQWLAIQQRLVAEGLLRSPARARAARLWSAPLLQLAAAIAIFLLGNYTAALIRGGREATSPPTQSIANRDAVTGGAQGSMPVSNALEQSNPGAANAAASAVREAELAYLNALTRYAEVAGGTESADPLARLAALESIVLTTRAALGQAPADPVINGYHLTALAQRDATIKRLASNPGQTWF